MTIIHRDLTPAPDSAAAARAVLEQAAAEAAALLDELAMLEGTASPMGAHVAPSLRRKIADARMSDNTALLDIHTATIREAIETARAWAAEVEGQRGALVAALDADPAVKRARAALAAAHKGAAALAARLKELRGQLAALGDAPASVEQAGAWAQQRAALQGEISAVEGLEADARRPIPGAQEALTAAEGAVLARLQAEAAGEVEAARKAWAAEQARVNREGAARVAGAERAAARVKVAERSLNR